MTIVLGIAVLALVALVAYMATRKPVEQTVTEPVDQAPAIQEAIEKGIAQWQRLNEEARRVDAQTAEATLDKRQAEIKALAERIAKGQEKIESEVRKRGEGDLQTRTLLEQMGQTVGNLNAETAGLKKALRQPQTRGQWGELQLRRCVEIAGMTEHVDFELQETLRTDDGRLRPDARFLLPEDRSLVADSKVPLEAFLDAQEAESEAERRQHLDRHARQAREHVSITTVVARAADHGDAFRLRPARAQDFQRPFGGPGHQCEARNAAFFDFPGVQRAHLRGGVDGGRPVHGANYTGAAV